MEEIKRLKKIIWEPIFSREGFSYFIVSLGFEGYVLDMENNLGWGYRDQLLISQNNFLTVYGSRRDQASFTAFAAKQNKRFFIKANGLIAAELEKARFVVKRINRRLADKNISADEMAKLLTVFYKHYRGLYSVYRFATLFDHYYDGKFKKELIKKFAKTKDACGRFFTRTDKTSLKIMRNYLSRLIKVEPKFLLDLSYQEIIDSIRAEKSIISKNELRLRHDSLILLAVDRKIRLFIKDRAEWLKKRLVFAVPKSEGGQIKGQTACPGKARGWVRVVFLVSQLKKPGQGLILVTPMTTVNHVPFLKNYAAIVTDEGGVTSHAAIISRELNIPCVVGTKIATKALKDGMMVEVNADQGVVTVLKK